MISSLNLSKPPKILIIHGLNNNLQGFHPLRDEFQKLGFECQLITLPGHGEIRDESRNFLSAFRAFDRQMKKCVSDPYVVIAFSQGALFLQLWLETNHKPAPKAQVLLAPALYIKHESKIQKMVSLLPSFAFIISQTPKKLKLYFKLHIWEYRTLLEAIKKFQTINTFFRIPTLILVDPQDELIHAEKLEENIKKLNASHVEFRHIDRPLLKARGLGKHHVLFHPDYFTKDQWTAMIGQIKSFFEKYR